MHRTAKYNTFPWENKYLLELWVPKLSVLSVSCLIEKNEISKKMSYQGEMKCCLLPWSKNLECDSLFQDELNGVFRFNLIGAFSKIKFYWQRSDETLTGIKCTSVVARKINSAKGYQDDESLVCLAEQVKYWELHVLCWSASWKKKWAAFKLHLPLF